MIVGLGIVLNMDCVVGFFCIFEICVIEILDEGVVCMFFFEFGDCVCMEVCLFDGFVFFGFIDQKVVKV